MLAAFDSRRVYDVWQKLISDEELYELLLGPFEKELRGIETVGIIPDGPLWHLPFEPLVGADGRFFIERTAVLYAPSITVYREMVQRARTVRAPSRSENRY